MIPKIISSFAGFINSDVFRKIRKQFLIRDKKNLFGIRLEVILPGLVFCASLIITFFVWRYVKKDVEKEMQNYFNFRCQMVLNQIEQRMTTYADIIISSRGLFNASENVSRDAFRRFVDSFQLETYYPGIQGIGFSKVIHENEINSHVKNVRDEGFPDYMIYPKGTRKLYTSIVYLEPFKGRNLRAFGYDMFSERVRSLAMQTACDSNKIVISGKVELVQETDSIKQAGFLMYLPVYKNGINSENIKQRRENLLGWVYAPFRVNNLMKNVFGVNEKDLDIEIYNDSVITNSNLMYDSNPSMNQFVNSGYSKTIKYNFGEHIWTLKIHSTPRLESRFDWKKPENIAILFVFGSFLFYLLTLLLVMARQRAIALNNTKDKFFSIISHDLRSPFNGFLNLSEIIATQPELLSEKELKTLSEELYKSAKNQYQLLNDLLDWSKMQMNSFSLKLEKAILWNVVESVIEAMNANAKLKNIKLENTIDCKIEILIDSNMIKLVLRNLISNSLKFTGDGGNIIIAAEDNERLVKVIVKDNGIGIAPDDINKLFKIDVRFSTLGTANEKGSGLGLMLCKEIIEKHGGTISVKSKVGDGSEFIFTIPVLK